MTSGRIPLCVTNRRLAWCSHAFTQRRDSLEGLRWVAVWIRIEGRLRGKLVASRVTSETASPSCTTKDLSIRDRPLWDPRGKSRNGFPRHGAHPPRPSCHILPGAMLQARRQVAHARSAVDHPSDSRHASRALDTVLSSSGSRLPSRFARSGYSDHGVTGRLRPWNPSPYVTLSLPPPPCCYPVLNPGPPYRVDSRVT